jgi:hypothetical protein
MEGGFIKWVENGFRLNKPEVKKNYKLICFLMTST